MLRTRIAVAIVLIALLFAVTLWLPAISIAVLVSAFSAVGAWELLRAEKVKNVRIYVYCCAAAFIIPLGFLFNVGLITGGICFMISAMALFLEAIFSYETEDEISASTVTTGFFAGILIPACLSALVKLRMAGNGGLLVIMCFVISAISDTGGYFAGRWFGKHRGIVKASPNKSAEGFLGSFIGGIAGVLVYGVILDKALGISVNYLLLSLYGALGNITTQVGDLAFSVIKRQNGIKDYGKIFPGHGGVLDRLDSTVFTAPLILMLLVLVPAI